MKREDSRSKIIKTEIKTRAQSKKFSTMDLIYLDNYDEYKKGIKLFDESGISCTDYAKMNNLVISRLMKTNAGRHITSAWLREGYDASRVCFVSTLYDINASSVENKLIGVCPSLRYKIPDDISKISVFKMLKNIFTNNKELDIKEVRHICGKTLYHILQIGEYPKSKVNEELSEILETLYNNGELKDEIRATGRWFSCNGQKRKGDGYLGKHSPEFEYAGNRYVRVISQIYDSYSVSLPPSKYSDGTFLGKDGSVRWVKVEPISFIIRNWDDMPTSINPNGNGKATYFDLRSEEVIFGNFPFYPNERYADCTKWRNSYIRGFLNGINIRKINEKDMELYNINGGNFAEECNFLNEAFNLSRQPIVEYAIPNGEFEICDDAFNGCVSLKKVIIHPNVRGIGKRAFEGLGFKYVYRTEDGNLIFSKELPRSRNEYKEIIELEKFEKSFVEFDYTMFVQGKRIEEIIEFSEVLTKNNFSLPYVYASALIRNGKAKEFFENSYFKFFKKEFPNINEVLLKFPEEERLDFFKFANVLGCFSTQKILDKNGAETKTIMAQKASLLLSRIVKTKEIGLR